MNLTEIARDIFCHDRYATETTGIVIDHVGEHEATCSLTVGEQHCNARGVAMGGVLFTLADFSSAIAANSPDFIEGNSELHWVSLNASIHYLSPTPLGASLIATSKALKHGHSIALYQTIIESPDNGKRYAIVETTMMFV